MTPDKNGPQTPDEFELCNALGETMWNAMKINQKKPARVPSWEHAPADAKGLYGIMAWAVYCKAIEIGEAKIPRTNQTLQ